MRLSSLLREALASAWASKVPTVLTLLVTAAMCLTTAATAGRNAALQQQVDRRSQDAGARVITIRDVGGDGFLTGTAVETIRSLSTVAAAAALTPPLTLTNAALGWGGPTVSGWGLVGSSPRDVVRLTQGRWPLQGEAIVSARSARALGLQAPAGALVSRQQQHYAIVGAFEVAAPYDWLADGVVFVPGPDAVAGQAQVLVDSPAAVGPTERVLRRILSPGDASRLSLESSRELARVSVGVGNDVSLAGHQTTVLVLGAGALFVGAVALADVLIRRRDLGRRRALGITRLDLVSLICLRTGLATAAGAASGVAAVMGYGLATGSPAPLLHTVASATLVVTCALIATVPVGFLAALQDPVSVLRTP